MHSHIFLNGRELEYPDPPTPVAAFLTRVSAALSDAAVTVNDMISLVYGPDNPVLDHEYFPGRAMVTPTILADPVRGPVYRVLNDLIERKRVQVGQIDPEAAFAKYTVGVPEAAGLLGISVQAVRLAIDEWRLPAVLRRGQWWLPPNAIESYKLGGRGPKPKPTKPVAPKTAMSTQAQAKLGGVPGASLSVRLYDEGNRLIDLIATGKDGGSTIYTFPDVWTWAAVKTTSSEETRVFEVEPAIETGEVEHAGLWVRGSLKIVHKFKANKAKGLWQGKGKALADFRSYVRSLNPNPARNGLPDGKIRPDHYVDKGTVVDRFLTEHPEFSRFRNELFELYPGDLPVDPGWVGLATQQS
ncbi:hypothetical protein [Fimbriiglobus ruber]|uniref:Helix-turn-helix domain-containing protein n=1 Tax=Fimbriiglobus ruber TaxID=1908690 RepID=A0A225D539_9BACT|nr:hypothetical protein [Fimbriiglobus ruber]OWK36063.1 hypothetical protein FRUB_08626 [Fimbriiglobus ruber]